MREGVRSGLFETSEAAAKYETHFVGGTVALLGDLDFRLCALRACIHFRPVRAIDEHDHVSVLLDGAGFPQIGEAGRCVSRSGARVSWLRNQHGEVQFLGETFEAAGDAGDFFLAIVETAAAGDQLQIIDND